MFAGELRELLAEEGAKQPYTAKQPANCRSYECKQNGCENPAYAKGFCNTHYIRHRNGADMNAPIQRRGRDTVCAECDRPVDGKGGWGLCPKHYRRRRARAIKSFLVEKLGGYCADCLGVFPIACFDFHHVGEKDDPISDLITKASVEAIEAEVSKCILLCSNCHRIEHHVC